MVESAKHNRPGIPKEVARAVRQRCGFGCVVCGLPLYQRHHIPGWANVQRHTAEELTLLCSTHHDEVTKGLLSSTQLAEFNRNPHNLRSGVSKPYDLHYTGDQCEIVIGSNRFFTRARANRTVLLPVVIDSEPVVGFTLEDGYLLLSLELCDEENRRVLLIEENELSYSISSWDVEFKGRTLIVREAARQIRIDMTFDVPNRVSINRGRFMKNGVEVLVRLDAITFTNNELRYVSNYAEDRSAGIVIGTQNEPMPCLIRVPDVPRYQYNKETREKWIHEEFG